MTAKIVIASAKRLIAVRQFWRNRNRIGADQRAGVADTDPEDEVDDVEGPGDGHHVAPDADAGPSQRRSSAAQEHREQR